MRASAVSLLVFAAVFLSKAGTVPAAGTLEPYRAAPDQVLVLYNADWPHRAEGTIAANDSREVAEYYAAMHADPRTGKKPYLLGLSCRHRLLRHLNEWFIREGSNDNGNGLLFTGKGAAPDPKWARDSRRVEIRFDDPETDWDSVRIICRSLATGEEKPVTPLRVGLKITGIPQKMGESPDYPPVSPGKGRTYRFDGAELFPGTVTVRVAARNREGSAIRDLSLTYHDYRDFTFTPVGADGVPDDRVLEEDVLQPVRAFLTDPANALPGGKLLKDHILYIVVVHGMPYSAKSVFGIEHGATGNRNDHGSLASLEQRLQTLFYPWPEARPPVVPFYMAGGPEAEQGVVNRIITTGMRRPQTGQRWNPYMHPDTYSFLQKPPVAPTFHLLPPLAEQRKSEPNRFAYGVTRIDGRSAEEAKRLVDYAVYATRYLRPEMDCRIRGKLGELSGAGDLAARLTQAEPAWGNRELELVGFGDAGDFDAEGLPFLARSAADGVAGCGAADWKKGGFYPGGLGRHVISNNGLNYRTASVWEYLDKGVTVTAAGAPAYGGGPHITNATFWDNRILLKYLLRGRDLGEVVLRSTYYVNWSTSFLGDPLLHPDLHTTVMDTTPPRVKGVPRIRFSGAGVISALIHVDLDGSPAEPEVALMAVTARDGKGGEIHGVSRLYSRRPEVVVEGLKQGTGYVFDVRLIDPYGNATDLPPIRGRTGGVDAGG